MLRASSRPRTDVILGYWAPLLASPQAAESAVGSTITSLRAQATPYTLVFGEEPDAATRRWMVEHFPEAKVIALPNSGHFPHVAHPDEFAHVLTAAAASNKSNKSNNEHPDA
jgi:pimeloyl-ACP methyl ester carboxylesterase